MSIMKYLFLFLLAAQTAIAGTNAKAQESNLTPVNYSAPAFIEYEKTPDIKYNNQMVLKNLLDTIHSFDNFEIIIYYHDDKSYYFGLSIKNKLKIKIPLHANIKITLCGKGSYYEQQYSYIPHGVAVFYKNLSVKQDGLVSRKLSITNQ